VNNRIPRIERIFLTLRPPLSGSLSGTSTVVSYIESSAGVSAAGRTGVTGLLFVAALFIAPLVEALIVVGSFMASAVGEIDWADFTIAIPAFLTMMMIH